MHQFFLAFSIFPAPALESTTSPKNPGSFYWRMILRNQDLCARYTHCSWGVTASRSSQWTEPGNVCIYTNLCICTHLCLFMCPFICVHVHVCVCTHEFILTFPTPTHYLGVPSSISSFLICKFFLWSDKPVLIHSRLLICSTLAYIYTSVRTLARTV